MSAEYGLVCDNVVNYEVVLANATIVNANASSNTDLYWALKGGGNQFGGSWEANLGHLLTTVQGIVTKFTMKTHAIGQVWGGIRSYAATEAEALLNATENFNENYGSHPEAAVIVTGEITIESLLEIFVVFFFYDGATPPAGVFDEFNAIPTLTDGVKVQSYYDLVSHYCNQTGWKSCSPRLQINSDDSTNLYGLRYLIRVRILSHLISIGN